MLPLSCFTAIYNFQGNGAPQLSLQIGDVVRIQETCGGESRMPGTLADGVGTQQYTPSTSSPLLEPANVCGLLCILIILAIRIY